MAQHQVIPRADLDEFLDKIGVTKEEHEAANARFNIEYPHGPILPYLCQQQCLAWIFQARAEAYKNRDLRD